MRFLLFINPSLESPPGAILLPPPPYASAISSDTHPETFLPIPITNPRYRPCCPKNLERFFHLSSSSSSLYPTPTLNTCHQCFTQEDNIHPMPQELRSRPKAEEAEEVKEAEEALGKNASGLDQTNTSYLVYPYPDYPPLPVPIPFRRPWVGKARSSVNPEEGG